MHPGLSTANTQPVLLKMTPLFKQISIPPFKFQWVFQEYNCKISHCGLFPLIMMILESDTLLYLRNSTGFPA